MGDTIMDIYSIVILIGIAIGIIIAIKNSIKNKISDESNRKAQEIHSRWWNDFIEEVKKKNTIEREKLIKDITEKTIELKGLKEQEIQIIEKSKQLDIEYNKFNNEKIIFKKLVEEKTIGFPWIAEAYSLYKTAKYDQYVDLLTSKDRPALKSADIVRIAKQEAKESEKKYFIAKGLLAYYENIFPDIVEIIAVRLKS